MAVSGPLFRDLTPPNLESRAKKKAPEKIGRSFQRAIVCFTAPISVLRKFRDFFFLGVQRRAGREAERKQVLQAYEASKQSKHIGLNLDFDASGPGRAAIWAILALSRARHALEMALIFLYILCEA